MIYYIDMDETLLHTTRHPPKRPSFSRKKFPTHFLKWKAEEILYWEKNAFQMEDSVMVCKRPYAENFLKTLRSTGKVIVLSAGQIDYVKEALKVTGFVDFIDGSFSSRRYNEDLPRERDWVLIDDRPQDSAMVTIKIKQITSNPIRDHNYIQVSAFTGNPKDTVLRDLLEQSFNHLVTHDKPH